MELWDTLSDKEQKQNRLTEVDFAGGKYSVSKE